MKHPLIKNVFRILGFMLFVYIGISIMAMLIAQIFATNWARDKAITVCEIARAGSDWKDVKELVKKKYNKPVINGKNGKTFEYLFPGALGEFAICTINVEKGTVIDSHVTVHKD